MLNLETLYMLVGLSMWQIDDDALEQLLPGSDNAILDTVIEPTVPTPPIDVYTHPHMLIDDEFTFGI